MLIPKLLAFFCRDNYDAADAHPSYFPTSCGVRKNIICQKNFKCMFYAQQHSEMNGKFKFF